MTTNHHSSPREGNLLLARVPPAGRERLLPKLRPVKLEQGQVLHEARARIHHAYFPVRCVASALNVMSDGRAIEVATVGNEGMVGQETLFGAESSPNRLIVQVPGDALQAEADVVRREAERDASLGRVLANYHLAFQTQVSQSVACNGLHGIQERCCRWLLMTHDRVGSDELPLTHEYLAMMLGVRRSSVTDVLHPLQQKGLIAIGRGRITVQDRGGLEEVCCECYRVVRDEYERLLGPMPEAS